jgi:signal transduction histidine kinase/GAF domain-containing protein
MRPFAPASGGPAATPAAGAGSAPGAGRPLVADLLALRELQASLALEETDTAVVRVGTNAVVEILAIECGLTLVDATPHHPEIRFGWCQGRAMPREEVETLGRGLEAVIEEVRRSRVASRLLGSHGAPGSAPLPQAARASGLQSILVLGLGSGGRRTGALVLASRDADAFAGEPLILAELLAAEMSEHCERVRALPAGGREALRQVVSPSPGGPNEDARRLRERNAELEAQVAIISAASLSHDADRQVDLTLRKALDLSGHKGGAIYLVETTDSGDDILRFARGLGDPAWLDRVRLPRWRRGEGPLSRICDGEEALVVSHLAEAGEGFDRDLLQAAGYRRMACQPLLASGRVIGVLQMFGDEARPYDEAEKRLLKAIARQVGLAIHGARLLGDLTRHSLALESENARLRAGEPAPFSGDSTLEALATSLAIAPDGETRAAAVLAQAARRVQADAAAVLHLEARSGRLRLLAQRGFPDAAAHALWTRPVEDAILARGLEGGDGVLLDLADPDALEIPWTRLAGYRHLLLLPCRAGEEIRGLLLLATRYRDRLLESERSTLAPYVGILALLLDALHHAAPIVEPAEAELAEARSVVDQHTGPRGIPVADDPGVPPGDAPTAGEGPSSETLIQAQKMESLGRLAVGIAHDFNNSLGAIMGHASHIRTLVPDYNPVHGKAVVIEEQSQRVADLVRRLLPFAHGGTGEQKSLRVNELVEETVAVLLRTLDPSVVLESRCAPNLPSVEADPGQIRQALLNLAVNARDALQDGGRIIFETRAGHLDGPDAAAMGIPPGDYVSLAVSDNGAGMPPEVARQAFEPFFTTKAVTQGSGLGLTVVQDIVHEHGGHVALSSAEGVGTAVRMYLPVARGAAPSENEKAMVTTGPIVLPPGAVADLEADPAPDLVAGDAPGEAEAPGATRSHPSLETRPLRDTDLPARILVVDDEAVLRDMTVEMLRSRGHEVLTAKDGVEALEIYKQEWGRVDLVLLDMIMPRLGGLETFRRLLGMDRKAKVLLCSGLAQTQQAQEALRQGAMGLLPKPFGMAELVGWVERCLAGRALKH